MASIDYLVLQKDFKISTGRERERGEREERERREREERERE